jgi:glutamate 5-kinase
VEVTGADGRLVGKGISAFSADELRVAAGLKTAQVRELLPEAPEEVVHRDQFVLA